MLPEGFALEAGTLGGRLASYRHSERRDIVRKNLARVVPKASEELLDALVAEAYASYGRYWADGAILTPKTRVDEARFSVEDPAKMKRLLEGGGAIIALPHVGSWEIGGLYLAQQQRPLLVVAEEIEPPELFRWFLAQREAIGIKVVTPGPKSAPRILNYLREGGLVGLISDRDVIGDGIEVSFFGESARVPGGAALLALRAHVPIYPAAIYQNPGPHYHVIVRDPLFPTRQAGLREDVQRVTQDVITELERLIAIAPAQWHVFQPHWLADLHDAPS
jgi:KDO2-lipid IV(A) lauroyltransferase